MIDVFKKMVGDAIFLFVIAVMFLIFKIPSVTPYDLMLGSFLTASFAMMMIYGIKLFGEKR